MSLTFVDEIKCPCGETFESELYQSVSVTKNPELKEAVLAGEFNIVQCPACKQFLYAERFILYHDPANELLAFVYPKAMEQQQEEIKLNMAQNFTELQNSLSGEEKFNYQPFLMFGLDDLCTLVRLEEEISMEADVVQSLCETFGLTYKRIHLDSARRKNVLPLIPLILNADGKPIPNFKVQLTSGLHRILELNDQLKHYQNFLTYLESGSDCQLEEADFLNTD